MLAVLVRLATKNHRFFNAEQDFFGGLGDQITVDDGKITRYVWGTEDPSQCE